MTKKQDLKVRTFDRSCGQGDCLCIAVESIPANAKRVEPIDGMHIIAHSETGHHHVMVLDKPPHADLKPNVEVFSSEGNPLLSWIKVNRPTKLEHQRGYDVHAPILLKKGLYEVRRQREHTPEGWRAVAD